MKAIRFCINIIAALTLLSGCNDDFLKNEEWKPALRLEMRADPPLYLTSKQQLTFTIPGAGNSSFSLAQFPMWMIPEDIKGNASNDNLTLTYRYDNSIFWSSSPFSFRFKVDGIGQVEVLVNFIQDLFAVEGKARSAAFDKSGGIMYIATQVPNQVMIYNTADDSKRFIPLTNAPKCIKLSENGKLAFVGHSGLLSVIDTDSEKVISRIETDLNIYDLVYGENDCYISVEQDYIYNICTRSI